MSSLTVSKLMEIGVKNVRTELRLTVEEGSLLSAIAMSPASIGELADALRVLAVSNCFKTFATCWVYSHVLMHQMSHLHTTALARLQAPAQPEAPAATSTPIAVDNTNTSSSTTTSTSAKNQPQLYLFLYEDGDLLLAINTAKAYQKRHTDGDLRYGRWTFAFCCVTHWKLSPGATVSFDPNCVRGVCLLLPARSGAGAYLFGAEGPFDAFQDAINKRPRSMPIVVFLTSQHDDILQQFLATGHIPPHWPAGATASECDRPGFLRYFSPIADVIQLHCPAISVNSATATVSVTVGGELLEGGVLSMRLRKEQELSKANFPLNDVASIRCTWGEAAARGPVVLDVSLLREPSRATSVNDVDVTTVTGNKE